MMIPMNVSIFESKHSKYSHVVKVKDTTRAQ